MSQQLRITEGELNIGLGTQQKEFDITRKIQIVYLDDTLRIARSAPGSGGQAAVVCQPRGRGVGSAACT
jgi:hypothetical protein